MSCGVDVNSCVLHTIALSVRWGQVRSGQVRSGPLPLSRYRVTHTPYLTYTRLYSFRLDCRMVSFTAANTKRMFSVSGIQSFYLYIIYILHQTETIPVQTVYTFLTLIFSCRRIQKIHNKITQPSSATEVATLPLKANSSRVWFTTKTVFSIFSNFIKNNIIHSSTILTY